MVSPSTYLNPEFYGRRTAGGRSSDGRRRRPFRQGRREKNHLIEAALFGHLDNAKDGRSKGIWAGFALPANYWRVWGAAPFSQNQKNIDKIKALDKYLD